MKLKLAETFTSIQGEGVLTGTRMFFIRFGGCSVVSCPLHPSNGGLCDENWRTQSVLNGAGDIKHLSHLASDSVGPGGWVCVTGGEPADQPEALYYLCEQLQLRGLNVNLQTSGTKPINIGRGIDFLTVSPKCGPDELEQLECDELKLVYTGQSLDELRTFQEKTYAAHHQLQPLWDGDRCTNMEETIQAIHQAGELGVRWDLSLQAHKFMGVK